MDLMKDMKVAWKRVFVAMNDSKQFGKEKYPDEPGFYIEDILIVL